MGCTSQHAASKTPTPAPPSPAARSVSADGSRVYFTEGATWLREIPAGAHELGGKAREFQTATPDGSVAFYTKAATSTVTKPPPTPPPTSPPLAASGRPRRLRRRLHGLLPGRDGPRALAGRRLTPLRLAPRPPSQATTRRPPAPPASPPTEQRFSSSPPNRSPATTTTTPPPGCPIPRSSSGTHQRRPHLHLLQPHRRAPARPLDDSGAYANGAAPGSTDSYKPRNLSATQTAPSLTPTTPWSPATPTRPPTPMSGRRRGPAPAASPGCLSLISSGTDPNGQPSSMPPNPAMTPTSSPCFLARSRTQAPPTSTMPGSAVANRPGAADPLQGGCLRAAAPRARRP